MYLFLSRLQTFSMWTLIKNLKIKIKLKSFWLKKFGWTRNVKSVTFLLACNFYSLWWMSEKSKQPNSENPQAAHEVKPDDFLTSTVLGWAWLQRRCSRWSTRHFLCGYGRSRSLPSWFPSCSWRSSISPQSCGSDRSPPTAQHGWSARRDWRGQPGLCGGRCPRHSAWSQGRPVDTREGFKVPLRSTLINC